MSLRCARSQFVDGRRAGLANLGSEQFRCWRIGRGPEYNAIGESSVRLISDASTASSSSARRRFIGEPDPVVGHAQPRVPVGLAGGSGRFSAAALSLHPKAICGCLCHWGPVSRATVLTDPQGSRDLRTHGRRCSGVSSIIVLLIREMKYEESNQNGDCNSHRRIHDGHRTSQAEYVRLVTFGVSLEL
jgi:hypothetical protein